MCLIKIPHPQSIFLFLLNSFLSFFSLLLFLAFLYSYTLPPLFCLPGRSTLFLSPQLQIYGYNAQLYRNFTQAATQVYGVVALAVFVQVGVMLLSPLSPDSHFLSLWHLFTPFYRTTSFLSALSTPPPSLLYPSPSSSFVLHPPAWSYPHPYSQVLCGFVF